MSDHFGIFQRIPLHEISLTDNFIIKPTHEKSFVILINRNKILSYDDRNIIRFFAHKEDAERTLDQHFKHLKDIKSFMEANPSYEYKPKIV